MAEMIAEMIVMSCEMLCEMLLLSFIFDKKYFYHAYQKIYIIKIVFPKSDSKCFFFVIPLKIVFPKSISNAFFGNTVGITFKWNHQKKH